MRRVCSLVLSLDLVLTAAAPAQADPGVLDPLFGGDGTVTAFPHGSIATGVAIDHKHRIVAVGYTVDGGVDVAIARFRPDGSPDPAFGKDGRMRFDLGGADYAFDVAIAASGGIAIAGRRVGAEDRMFVLRLRPNGRRQPGFGRNGLKLVDFGKPQQGANAIAFTPQDRIVIGGFTSNGVLSRSALARLSDAGRFDPGFSGDGRASFEIGSGSEQVNDLLVLGGGRIVAAGYAETGQAPRLSLFRATSSGALDHGFGTGGDGASTFDIAKGPDVANALTIAGNGDYLLAGRAGTDADWAVLAARGSGRRDPGYGRDGQVVLNLATAFEEATDIVAWGARALLVGRIRGHGSDDIGVVRLKATGRPDPTFAGDGIARIDVSGSGSVDTAAAAALQSNGKVIAAGQTWHGGIPRFVIARIRKT
jgi:uncharacterized delta-60 repeat protein